MNEDHDTSRPFGGSGRYYSESMPQTAHSDARQESLEQLAFLLKLVDTKDVERVMQTVKRWNPTIRERLRSATGLKLSTADDRQVVPIRVDPGLPRPFSEFVGKEPDFALWWLTARRPSLEQTAVILKDLEAHYEDVASATYRHGADRDNPEVGESAIADVRVLIENSLSWAKKQALLDQFKQIEADVLGAYFYNQSHIRLYWVVISIVSRMIGVTVEDLTIVVMVHELAHAYTHVGKDIDGKEWSTMAFANSDIRIVEGVAQFYTQFVCASLAERLPAVETAFTKLLEHQSDVYADFQDWVTDQRRVGEIVRFALVDFRSRTSSDYGEFRDIIAEIAAKLPQ